MLKTCSECKVEKNILNFGKDKTGKFGVKSKCKTCMVKLVTEYNQKNKEKIKQYNQTPERKKTTKLYREKNKEHINKHVKSWRKNNPEKVKNQAKQYYQNHKEEHQARTENFRKINPQYFRNYFKKYKNDPIKGPLLKLHNTLNSGIRNGMKKINNNKYQSSLNVVGLESWDKFREHIESLWVEGMNWNNYGNKKGQWSIDHIIPIDSVKNIDEVNKINHYTNLQPLWWDENIRKSNKLLEI